VNDGLIYDWNQKGGRPRPSRVLLNDETLRDGLQSPSVKAPTIEQKLRILHLLDRIGIDTSDIGLPGAGPHVVKDVERLAREIVDCKLTVQANCAANAAASSAPVRFGGMPKTGPSITCSAVPRKPSGSPSVRG
jgi:hypothetical protein